MPDCEYDSDHYKLLDQLYLNHFNHLQDYLFPFLFFIIGDSVRQLFKDDVGIQPSLKRQILNPFFVTMMSQISPFLFFDTITMMYAMMNDSDPRLSDVQSLFPNTIAQLTHQWCLWMAGSLMAYTMVALYNQNLRS